MLTNCLQFISGEFIFRVYSVNINLHAINLRERGGVMHILKQIRAIALCICLIILTACGSNIETGTNNGENSDSAQSVTNRAVQVENTVNSVDSSETVTVIAKSNNTVSDAEKKVVLDQLGAEMDGLLNTINEVEANTIQDSELSF